MLRVVHSNRFERLVDALVDGLPNPIDPFAGHTVVVGSRLVARHLQHRIAESRGVCAGPTFPFLERFLLTTYVDARAEEVGLCALDRPALDAVLASVLGNLQAQSQASSPELATVVDYLGAAGAEDAGMRRVQLAGQLGALYWSYALTRSSWLDTWEAGGEVSSDAGGEPRELAWQSALWRATFAHLRQHQPAKRFAIVPRLPTARRALGMSAPALPQSSQGATTHVSLIGFSHLAPAYIDALADLAVANEIRIYMLNPCAEFWEDVRRPRAQLEVEVEPEVVASEEDPRLLALWGRPVRDTMAALTAASDGDLTADFDSQPAAALGALGQLLADTVARGAAPESHPSARVSADPVAGSAGITVRSCPSIRRELEIIGSDIRRRLADDPSLMANQIAVLVAPSVAESYLALCPAVFERLVPAGPGQVGLPLHIVDAPFTQLGQIGEAATALLELPLGRFTRRDVLALITHPCCVRRFPHVDPDDWVRWIDRLGIVHGADAHDHQGSYLEESGHFHWEQGIRRLALGAFMLGDRPGHPADGVAVGEQTLVPEEVGADHLPSAASLAMLVRSLVSDVRFVRDANLPLARWADVFSALFTAYLFADDDRTRRDLDHLIAAAASLRTIDFDGRPLSFVEVSYVLRARMRGLSSDRGEPLSEGVMVAPLLPMRPLPMRVIYVAGLGEGVFPASEPHSSLDARHAAPARRGDVSPRDRDRQAFFEAVLAARDHIALSYVGRHSTSGEVLAPSSVVLELAEALAPYLGAADGAAALGLLTQAHPLHRWEADESLGTTIAPACAIERAAAAARLAIGKHLRQRQEVVPPTPILRRLLEHPNHEHTRQALGLDLAPVASASAAASTSLAATPKAAALPRSLSLATLRKFLESPIQAWASAVLRLGELPDDEQGTRSDEPLAEEPPLRAALLRECVGELLRGRDPRPPQLDEVSAAYARARNRYVARGQLPVGVFGEIPAEDDVARLQRWMTQVGELRGSAWRVGFARSRDVVDRLVPALPIALPLSQTTQATQATPHVVELTGQTELLVPGGCIVVAAGSKQRSHLLRGLVDQVTLAAAGIHNEPFTITVLSTEPTPMIVRADAWTQKEAQQYLRERVTELLCDTHGYLLPFDVAEQILRGREAKLPSRFDEHATRLSYGPITRDVHLDLPPDPHALVEARLGPLFTRVPGSVEGKASG